MLFKSSLGTPTLPCSKVNSLTVLPPPAGEAPSRLNEAVIVLCEGPKGSVILALILNLIIDWDM